MALSMSFQKCCASMSLVHPDNANTGSYIFSSGTHKTKRVNQWPFALFLCVRNKLLVVLNLTPPPPGFVFGNYTLL